MNKTNRLKITEETVKTILVDKCGWEIDDKFPEQLFYNSPCKRYVLHETKWNNLCDAITGKGWNLHVDNSDMQSLASCDVEYMDQISMIMTLYGGY